MLRSSAHIRILSLREQYSLRIVLLLDKLGVRATCSDFSNPWMQDAQASCCRQLQILTLHIFGNLHYVCAHTRIRTWDLSSISRMLYQLSYMRIVNFLTFTQQYAHSLMGLPKQLYAHHHFLKCKDDSIKKVPKLLVVS